MLSVGRPSSHHFTGGRRTLSLDHQVPATEEPIAIVPKS